MHLCSCLRIHLGNANKIAFPKNADQIRSGATLIIQQQFLFNRLVKKQGLKNLIISR